MEFFDWSMLGSYAGAVMAVGVITEITKDISFIKKIPTLAWSYVLALVVLLAAMMFGPGFTAEAAGLAVFNAAVVSLAANGGYEAIQRIKAMNTANDADKQE